MSNRRSEIVDEIDFALQQSHYVTTYTTGISDYRKAARQIVEVLESLGVFDIPKLSSELKPQLPQAPVSLSSPPSADVIEIFEWLLGYSDFPERRQGDGAFWWRKELRHRLEFLGIHIGGDAS